MCIELPTKLQETIKEEENSIKAIYKKMLDMDKKMEQMDKKIDMHIVQKPLASDIPSYSAALRNNLESKVNETNRLVQNIARQNEPEQSEN